MSSRVRSAKSKSPEVELFTRTPSISTCTWVGFAPRMRTVESFPGLPEVVICTPGTVRSTSSTWRYSWTCMASSGTTVTDAPVCSSRCSNRSAVTTTGSARLVSPAGAAPGVACAVS
jgi:hypothetical protein